jgi:NET1-associated nuclear protein 1 (U3 small nucleolar RNA-associated protein 17)
VMHWHSMPVTALTWSLEGGFLYSGGGERVLVKWRTTDNSRPSFLPRLAGGVVGVSVGVGVTAVQLDDNSVVVLDSQDKPAAQLTGMTRSSTGYPAGLSWDSRARLVVMNGRVGQLQMINVDTADCVKSLDITQQNYITQERDVTPQNSEVERVAVSDCGGHLATLDCCWTRVPRITLKFWTFNQTTQKFCLNTQVDCPHDGGAVSLRFRPGPSPLLASCGKDSKVKLWQFSPSSTAAGSWSCDSCLTYRGLAAGAVSWSSDGTLLAAAFSHVVTLWDKNCRLRTSLSPTEGDAGPVLCLQFGRHSSSRLLVSASSTSLTTWDILTLSPIWVLPLPASSPPLLLIACPSTPRLAVVHKDVIMILDPTSQTVLARLPDVNCTGAAVFAPNTTTADPVSCLYYVTYRGVVKRVGPRAGQVKQKTRLVEQKWQRRGH